MKKVFVIGLDCAPPQIVFEKSSELANIRYLIENGTSCLFSSTHPPITIPAWLSMATSKNPGRMGLYGFRNRKPGTYNDMYFSTSDKINAPCLWDILKQKDLYSCLVSIPPSFPPLPVNGNLISCFMCPSSERECTYPSSLKNEIEQKFGKYQFDVKFRTEDRDKLLKDIHNMTAQHFEVIKYLIQNKKWQFFMFVEIGVDRLQHGFWKYFDKTHQGYEKGNRYENAIMGYYKFLDEKIGQILNMLDDDTVIFLVSDHGAKAMKGAFCINQWLITKGYLVLNKEPKPGTDLDKADINWSKTKVWAWGGYYARIFINLKGREPQGIIPQAKYEEWREKLKKELSEVKGPKGEEWKTKVYKPQELYPEALGDKPDLMAYIDDLSWRAAGTLGYESVYLAENDTGPDDAMHDWDGVFIMYDPKNKKKRKLNKISILDFAPTVLDVMGIDVPSDMEGKSILHR